MAATETRDDAAAIAALHASFDAQKAAFLRDPSPSAEVRRERVLAVAQMALENRLRIREAVVRGLRIASRALRRHGRNARHGGPGRLRRRAPRQWMAPEPRDADPAMYGTGRAEMRREPKGVIGNMVPWNFPYDLSLGPLVDMLAAGNRVIIKPSDFTPGVRRAAARHGRARRSIPTSSTSPSAASTWPGRSRGCAGTTSCTPAARASAARSPRRPPRTSSR